MYAATNWKLKWGLGLSAVAAAGMYSYMRRDNKGANHSYDGLMISMLAVYVGLCASISEHESKFWRLFPCVAPVLTALCSEYASDVFSGSQEQSPS